MTRIFWSWQSDSPAKVNRSFVLDCLRRSAKALSIEEGSIVEVDRDSVGVGGSPALADTILRKIESSDVFVWDATIVVDGERPSPNPNVLFELGYAYASLGAGRIIGVMNDAVGPGPEKLPFDLQHRRWPIRYSLPLDADDATAVRDSLTSTLKGAIRDCLAESKRSVERSKADAAALRRLWSVLDSTTMANWWHERQYSPQYWNVALTNALDDFCVRSALPENRISNEPLRQSLEAFVSAARSYLEASAVEMSMLNETTFVLNAKRYRDDVEDGDARYREVLNRLGALDTPVWKAWEALIEQIAEYHHEILDVAAR